MSATGQWSRRGLLGTGAGLAVGTLAAACGGGEDESADADTSGDGAEHGADGEQRSVEHYLGAADIPVEPQRIVSLDAGAGLQVALELGAPLVGATVLQGDVPVPEYLPEPVQEYEQLDWVTETNLEQIQLLEPDLIIGNPPSTEESLATLDQIAPTVAYANSAVGAPWRDGCRQVADFLGGTDEHEQLLADYEERVAAFAAEHAALLDRFSFALVRFTTEEMRIVTDSVIFGSGILTDCGVRLTESSQPDDPEETFISLSQEQIGMLDDADVILWFGGGGGFADGDAGHIHDTYTQNPLWQRLPAVAADRAFELPELTWWDGGSVSAANACVDELEKIMANLDGAT